MWDPEKVSHDLVAVAIACKPGRVERNFSIIRYRGRGRITVLQLAICIRVCLLAPIFPILPIVTTDSMTI